MECHTSVSCGLSLEVYGMPHVCKLWFGFRGLWNATRLLAVVWVYRFMECHTPVSCVLGLEVNGMPHVCKLWFGFRGLWNATRLYAVVWV